jgi:N-acetylglucosamine repressor
MRCTCGNYGCLETYVSGDSILQKAIEGVKLGRNTALSGLSKHVRELELEHIYKAARQGDEFAKGLFDEAGIYLGIGISNLINILNPDLIVIGGELTKCKDLYLDRTMEIVTKKVWKNSRVNLLISGLDSSSAAVGAALQFVQKIFHGEMPKVLN